VYSEGGSGVDVAFGASFGYLAGFIVAAFLVGALARRGLDRTPGGVLAAFAVGTAAIYALGVGWLMLHSACRSARPWMSASRRSCSEQR
jgi:biotin transport system substrate-specific component